MDTRSTQRSPHINCLPTEVLLKVFSYLRPAYLIQTVSKVCMYWEGLSEDPYFYKIVELRGDELSTETSIKLLKLAPLLEALTLVGVECMDEILNEVSQHNHRIRSLVLEETRQPFSKHMMSNIQKCTKLHTLILRGYFIREEEFYNSVFCLELPHLKTLDVEEVGLLNSWVEEQLANSCFELENLELSYLHICSSEYSSREFIIALCSRFQKTLRSLRLCKGIWSQEAYCALLKCDRLETLGICWPTDISNEDVLTISLIPNLRHLELQSRHLEPVELIQLFTSDGLTNLVSLQLDMYITDEVATAIGDHLKNLTIFSLQETRHPIYGSNRLTRIGVGNVIKGCFGLLELNVKFLGAEDDVKEVLLLIPEYLSGLKKLKLFPYRPKYVFKETETREAVAQIKKQMPNLQLKLET